MEMNLVMKTMKSVLQSESGRDILSLSHLANKLLIPHMISNKPNVIKKVGNYQIHNQFLIHAGREFVRDALQQFLDEHLEAIKDLQNSNPEQAKDCVLDKLFWRLYSDAGTV